MVSAPGLIEVLEYTIRSWPVLLATSWKRPLASLPPVQQFEMSPSLKEGLKIRASIMGKRLVAGILNLNYEGTFRVRKPESKTAERLWQQRRKAYLLVPVLLILNYGFPTFMQAGGASRHLYKEYPDNKAEYKSLIEHNQALINLEK